MSFESNEPCAACGKFAPQTICYHHLYTQKSRPDLALKDWNMTPCCLIHHKEYHDRGTTHMSAKYQGVLRWLEANNWIFDSYLGKWRHDGANLS